jgi:hypothetical protein
MPVGNLNQKVSPYLVGFVFTLIIVTIGFLYIIDSAESRGKYISTKGFQIIFEDI